MSAPNTYVHALARIIQGLDLTEVFKTKGDLKRWSAKRTIGGVVVMTACNDIAVQGADWPAVLLCAIGILPLCLSLLEK